MSSRLGPAFVRALTLSLAAAMVFQCGPTNQAVTPAGEKRWREMKYLDKRVGRGPVDFPAGFMSVQGRDNTILVWNMDSRDFEYFEDARNAADIADILARARAADFQSLVIRVNGRLRKSIPLATTPKK